jgi:hypothetical protein
MVYAVTKKPPHTETAFLPREIMVYEQPIEFPQLKQR